MSTTKPDRESSWDEFLAPWLDSKQDKGTIVALAAVSDGAAATFLDTVELSKCKQKPGELAARFIAGARSHCEAFGTVQRYSCAVMRGAAVLGQRFLKLEPLAGGLTLGQGDPIDGPIGPALLKSGLRHIERMQQLHSRSAEGMLLNLSHVVEQQNQELRRYRAADIEKAELIQELLDRKAARELEYQAQDREQSRMDEGFKQLGHVGKLLMARLSGAEPASVLMRKIPIEKLGPLLSDLDDEGQQAVRELLAQATEAEQARRGLLQLTAGAEALPSSPPSSPPSSGPDGSNGGAS